MCLPRGLFSAAFQAAILLRYNEAMTQRHPIQNYVLMFVTTNTKNRRPIFDNPAYAAEAIDRLYRMQNLHPFFLFGFVIMPDHCHFLLNIPAPYTMSQFMNSYKTGMTFDLGIGSFWQPRYDLRTPDDGWAALRYIYENPVKAGLAFAPEEYRWSSASGKYDVSILP